MQLLKTKFTPSLLILSLVLFVSAGFFPKITNAGLLTSAKDTMSSQATSATSTHTITFNLATGKSLAAAGRLSFDFVDADFALSAIGTWQPADFAFNDGTARTINAVSSSSGVDPTCTAGANNVCVNIDTTNDTFVVFAAGSYTSSSSAAAITFTINGTTTSGTGTMTNKASDVDSSLVIINDVTNSDSTTTAVVVEANDVVTVSATVNPTLTLNISANTVALGTITTSTPGKGSHTARIGTNAAGGFLLTYNGETLKSGTNAIAAYGALQPSAPGTTAGFGINMKLNTTPAIGAEVTTTSGVCAAPATNYATANSYSYVANTTTSLTNQLAPADCTYTVSYVANITAVTPAGAYSTPVTFIASGTF